MFLFFTYVYGMKRLGMHSPLIQTLFCNFFEITVLH